MKPSIRLIALSLFAFLFITNAPGAQNLFVAKTSVKEKNIISSTLNTADHSSSAVLNETTLAETHPKLIRKFSQLFPVTGNVAWSKLDDNFYVSFEKDGQTASAVFTEKGALNYLVNTCSLQQLPASLQQKISNKYNGYDLFHASQIFSNGTESYSVVLENATGFVTLLHAEDETEETHRVDKPTVN